MLLAMSARSPLLTRLIVACSVAALCSLFAVGARAAVHPTFGLSVGVTPNVAGTPASPAPVALELHVTSTPNTSEPPFSTSRLSFEVDPNVTLGSLTVGACDVPEVVARQSYCLAIGDGTATFTALGLTEPMTATVFQQRDAQALLVVLDGSAPLQIHSVVAFQRTTSPTGSTVLTADVAPELQQPAPGVYATLTDTDVTLRQTVGLAGCPTSVLSFAAHAVFTEGSTADATATSPCTVPPPPPPIVPRFAMRAHRHGRVLGRLLALRSIKGLAAGKVTLTCTAGCPRYRLGSVTIPSTRKGDLIRLRPPITLTSRTRIRLTTVDATGTGKRQLYRFVRRGGSLVARAVPT